MLPIVTVPETIRTGMAPYREVFCREAGFEQVGRYVTGLILSPNAMIRFQQQQICEEQHIIMPLQ
jgi:hypothetical protein